LTTLPTYLEIQARQATPELTEVLLDHRDTCLVDCLASVHQARQTETIDVAVVYGADHMPAVTHELLRRFGYRPRTAEWLTVFDF
jgi:pheromone shutdown protein TraB